MKKIAIIVLILTFLFSLAACGGNNRQMVEECKHEYESETISNATYTSDGEIKKGCIYCGDEQTEYIPKLENPIDFKVLGVSTYVEEKPPLVMPDGMEIPQLANHWMLFKIEVTNKSEQDISSISGNLLMSDDTNSIKLFGTFSETIKAGETVVLENYGMTVNYNDLTMADNMLYGSKFEELTFEFNLTEVKN